MAHPVLLSTDMPAFQGALATNAPTSVTERGEPGGVGLHHLLSVRGPLPVAEAADIVVQACRILAPRHGSGVVHLELSPRTVRVTADASGRLVVHIVPPSHAAIPETGYAAPEQLLRGELGARADVFALGAIFYELVTGRAAFPNDASQFIACLHEGIPAMSTFAWVPPAVEQVVFQCMSPAETTRFADASELGRALEHVLAETFPLGSFPPPDLLAPSWSPPPPASGDLPDSGLREHWPLVVLPPIALMLAMALVHVLTNGIR